MKSWQKDRLDLHKGPIRLYINDGKNKGKYCVVRNYAGSGKISVSLEDTDQLSEIHYTALEELDEFGSPKILPVVDMTGREIMLDTFVCYSISAGNNSHALEIGKVYEFTRTGAVKVRTVARDGQKVSPNSWNKNETTINNPLRSIRLPVDEKTMLMLIMQDFEELAKQM